MKKRTIVIIICIAIIACLGIIGTILLNKPKKEEKVNETESTKENPKTLVVYYSAQSHTEEVAKKIAKNLGADIFEIEPAEVYTDDDLDWTNENSRVNKEHNDESLRNIALKTTEVPNWDSYERVLIGYPIWWGIAAWPTDSFVKAVDFGNKTVYPFCTSMSSSLGESDDLLKAEAKGGDWKEGKRFSSNAGDDEIKEWTDSL